jgi:hypothetical protein
MFNVGDKVKVLPYSNDKVTTTGTVMGSLDDETWDYEVFVDDHSNGEAGSLAKILFGTPNFPFRSSELAPLEG